MGFFTGCLISKVRKIRAGEHEQNLNLESIIFLFWVPRPVICPLVCLHVLVNNLITAYCLSGGKSRSFRTTRGHSPEVSGVTSQSANQSSLELLQDMLAQVETELACLEPRELSGPSEQPELQHGRGLTGFSVALVGTLGRIAGHLRRVSTVLE